MAEVLKALGYATGQFGKNHLGDRDDMLPTAHGFDEFFGNLYHLNAEEEPEYADYPKDPEFRKKFGPRGVLHSYADGIDLSDTGPLNRKRMETVDQVVSSANGSLKRRELLEPAAVADAERYRSRPVDFQPARSSARAAGAEDRVGRRTIRTGLTKVGLPGADVGIRSEDPSVAAILPARGYATASSGRTA